MPSDRQAQGRKGLTKLNRRIDTMSARYLRAESILTSLVARTVLAGTLGVPKVRRATRAQAKVMLDELDRVGIPEGAKIVEEAYQLGIRLAAKEVTVLGVIDKQALELIQANLKERLGAATTHVGRRVDDVFRKEALRLAALNLGDQDLPVGDALQRRLVKQGITAFVDRRGRSWGLAQYARMAVKTTTSEAVFYGTQTTLIGEGLDIVDVNSVRSPCDICKPYDGGTFSLSGADDEYPFLDIVFPAHPNCISEGSNFDAVGDILSASRAYWSGPLVQLELASGVTLAVGPNHPLLTESGWVPAVQVSEGQYLFDSRLRQRHSLLGVSGGRVGSLGARNVTIGMQDQHQAPTRVEDVFASCLLVGSHSLIPPSGDDFHGDAKFFEGEVDVVLPHNPLSHVRDTERVKVPSQESLFGSLVYSGAGSLPSDELPVGLSPMSAPDRRVGKLGLGSLAEFRPGLEQTLADGVAGNFMLAREVGNGAPVEVFADQVVNVHELPYRGYVYDFETSSGMYLANDIVTHNCQHYITVSRHAFDRRRAAA